MTTTPRNKTREQLPRPLIGAYVAVTVEALEHFNRAPQALVRQLDSGALLLVWSGPSLPPPSYCRYGGEIDTDTPAGDWAGRLIDALIEQADRYGAQGLDISACDCWWLVAKIRGGALQLVSADLLQAIGGRIHSQEAGR
jgi:hypothetical protein